MTKLKILIIAFLIMLSAGIYAQPGIDSTSVPKDKILIDQVVAVVGSYIITYSDVENEYLQFLMQGNTKGMAARCSILEELLFQKLLLNQADLDSVQITDKQVDAEVDRRMRYFIDQIGSKEKLEEYFKKSMLEIKEDLKPKIKDHLMIQQVQSKITQDVKVTPSEVSEYFNSIPPDSLPLISSEIEVYQIVKEPPVSSDEVQIATQKITDLRNRILKGEKFATLANLYSEDKNTMTKGGEIGLTGRGELPTEIEAVAYGMKQGDVSPIIKTKEGYHIIQLIERRGEYINIRQILIIPKPSTLDLVQARKDLENIKSLIEMDSITFEKAAVKHSTDPTGVNGGAIINAYSGNTKFDPADLDPTIFFIIDKLKVGEISAPQLFTDENGLQAYRLLLLKSRTAPHKANLKDDYPKIQATVQSIKQNKEINKWINKKTEKTYVKISNDFDDCKFQYDWGKK